MNRLEKKKIRDERTNEKLKRKMKKMMSPRLHDDNDNAFVFVPIFFEITIVQCTVVEGFRVIVSFTLSLFLKVK